ncbi:hypothetical protein [Ilumatobacter sp.]|uniref:hypothetical protein n=1 Tax=Ilumatobacter sp. TaxID=1967498 RepID=UPI003C4A0D96
MLERTRRLWDKQDQPVGDRRRLFAAVADAVDADSVLYPGSYVDISASFVWPTVTYVDVDRRANQFFTDTEGVRELLVERGVDVDRSTVEWIHHDYTDDLDIAEASVDLLVSLYAGFISEHCTEYLRLGGFLLVNPSHGDAAMASLDPRYRLHGVIVARDADYWVETGGLDSHLVPRRAADVTVELLHETGRGVDYTESPFAYLFERVS